MASSRMLLFTALLVAGSVLAGHSDPMPARLEQLKAIDDASFGKPDAERAKLISEGFARLFPDIQRSAVLSNEDLLAAFDATDTAVFYTSDAGHAQTLSHLLAELERRQLATADHYDSLYAALIQTRLFDEARAFQRLHPALTPLPTMRGEVSANRVVWTFDPSQDEITLQAAGLDADRAIVVVAHPQCHFSNDAFRAIEADPELNALLSEHALVIAPPGRRFEVPLFQQWNSEHPALPMRLAYDKTQWPQIASWGTPTFYFFRGGKLQEVVTGWPKEGRKAELLDAARAIGLE